ncbi:hypothetical protein PW5551_10065 [Petrotoga sp. 9PW.55.5.1]|uniref:D-alanyl-D-alanine carboxypeptidase/D-alanyl-D-alanine-endopeptidase n=1 Tax=Petrotoga sp. 9PW.55.5.1 TaxID=1308979 RepID=UPI000DC2E5E8|nr:D-alanyl-D-alanine carboxypeptidase [Petrotoga sp. 9PW.55.5.1]RAO98428.1 hypothetical protein PW5551_10065 [Petrotoga sp. 9PW.55.5.1]
MIYIKHNISNKKNFSKVFLFFFILLFCTNVLSAPISSRTPLIRDEEALEKIQTIPPTTDIIREPIESYKPSYTEDIPQEPTLDSTISIEILSKLNEFNGFVGFELRNLNSNTVLFEYNSEKLFIPASLTKLITAMVSLESLGDNYKFETKIYKTGEINTNFRGNLYIKGFGDPVLKNDQYKEILKRATVDRGIEKIYGDIIFDYSYLKEEGFGRGWMWDDPQPQIASLNIWQQSHESFKYKTNNEIKDYISFLTTLILSEIGVDFYGDIIYDVVPPNANLLYTHYSPPLMEIIQQMLKKSDNQIAEQLFRNLGAIYGKGTIEDSEKYFKQVIEETLGYKPESYVLKDGCGLSMYNMFSPKLINDILYYLYSKYGTEFLDLLASPDEESTLKNRFNFGIWGKTGSLYYDSAISGIFKSTDGNYYLFTLMENNFPFNVYKAKDFENDLIQFLYENL